MRMRSMFVASIILTTSTISAAACEADAMVGNWKCNGECTPGYGVSEFVKNQDGSFRWIDSLGNLGVALVADASITVKFPNGDYNGVILANCQQIEWQGDIHHIDTKQ